MKRQKRCACCGQLFRPDARLKGGQRYCSRVSCQRKRQRLNEKKWLCENPEVLAYKRGEIHRWWKAHPDYSKERRKENSLLEERNRTWSRRRMREIRSERRFDKTKSILTQLTQGQGDKCYLTRGIEWLHVRLTKPSRWSQGKALWENAARLKPQVTELRKAKVYDISESVFGRSP